MNTESVSAVRGVGPVQLKRLERLGIFTRHDLILHLPFRYEDRTRLTPLRDLKPDEPAVVVAEIVRVSEVSGRRGLHVHVIDGVDSLVMRLIHFNARQRRAFRVGHWVTLFGRVRRGPLGREMVHPEYRISAARPGDPRPEYVPIYPVTAGLSSRAIGKWIQDTLGDESLLPNYEVDDYTLSDALTTLHRPDPKKGLADIESARRRVAIDEIISFSLLRMKNDADLRGTKATPLPSQQALGRALLGDLGFNLTAAQKRVVTDVLNDLSSSQPMYRLLQGDVGSGKTVVAAFAAIRAAENGAQTAVLAPTELLAEQHYETFSQWLEPLGLKVGLLTGRLPAKVQRIRREAVASGQDLVVVGTHALFQAKVSFHNLALAIIDEQHRFGVHQRMMLRDKGRLSHQLVMTATPIPRTLFLTMYNNMELSTIDELPPGRTAVKTSVLANARREEVFAGIRRILKQGHQVYWVCTMIEESEVLDANALQTVFGEIAKNVPEARLGTVHGRLPTAEKSKRMEEFRKGDIDILLATTVIEVGIDVPNATLMVIENAERLGLAQLHQLRGRVGRGASASYCTLLYEPPLSVAARKRLEQMRISNDGFELAELDLELRGPGDVLGVRQSGEQNFRVADLTLDRDLIEDAWKRASNISTGDPNLAQEMLSVWSRGGRDYARA